MQESLNPFPEKTWEGIERQEILRAAGGGQSDDAPSFEKRS